MRKTKALYIITAVLLIISLLVGCAPAKEDFISDFNAKMSEKGLATLPKEMNVETEGNKKTLKSAALEDGITLYVEFQNNKNKALKVELKSDGTNNNWNAYAVALIEMYSTENYPVETTVKKFDNFEFDGSVKIASDPRVDAVLEIDSNDYSVKSLTINRS